MEQSVFLEKKLRMKVLERYRSKVLLKVLGNKIVTNVRRMIGHEVNPEFVVNYNGVSTFGTRLLDGEGTTVGQDYIRVLLELGLKRCGRIFEFCAGPGFIGYFLLANGFCENLTLADINPEAVKIARKTAKYNEIEHLVNIYQSDCLDHIPGDEKWDLVVSNPPHFLSQEKAHIAKNPRNLHKLSGKEATVQAHALMAYDPDWLIHKGFYASVKRFMKPDGLAVMLENCSGSESDIFLPMIEQGGGKFIKTCSGTDICGNNNGMYYVVSQW